MNQEDVLRPLTSAVKRRRFAVVDIETKDGDTQKGGFTRPFLAGYYDGQDYFETGGKGCLSAMLSFLLSESRDGWVYYAHNGGGFDWLHFLPIIAAAGYHYEIMTVSSTIQMLKVKRSKNDKSKGWTFLDSMKLIPTSLKKAAKAFGAGTQKEEIDYNTHEKDPRWSDYLKADCISLYQTLVRFHDLIEISLRGEVGITAASTAMKTYRRAYQPFPIERHSGEHDFFRESYYGGRVEIHRKSAEGLHYYDVNSCYPFVMREPMPVGEAVEWSGTPPESVKAGRVGFAEAEVWVPESIRIPVLPVRHPKTGRLLFPVGKFSGVWDAAEILAAQAQGATIKWGRSVWIEARPVLREMVDDLYKYRDKSRPGYDEGLSVTAKILSNSLYGKFAMSTEREKIVVLQPEDEIPENARPAQPMNPDCAVWYVTEECDAPYIAPQIASHVTALARLTLHKYLTIAEERGVLAYCDTDSIITTADLSDFVGPGLGRLKDEGEGVIYSGEFLQPKVYALKGDDGSLKVAMKGYRSKALKDFEEVKRGGSVTYENLEKIGALAAAGFERGPIMRTITKQIRTSDEKRTFDPCTGESRPLVFPL